MQDMKILWYGSEMNRPSQPVSEESRCAKRAISSLATSVPIKASIFTLGNKRIKVHQPLCGYPVLGYIFHGMIPSSENTDF